jgi:hypothetical protein
MTDSAKPAVWNALWSPWGAADTVTDAATFNARVYGEWFEVEAGMH